MAGTKKTPARKSNKKKDGNVASSPPSAAAAATAAVAAAAIVPPSCDRQNKVPSPASIGRTVDPATSFEQTEEAMNTLVGEDGFPTGPIEALLKEEMELELLNKSQASNNNEESPQVEDVHSGDESDGVEEITEEVATKKPSAVAKMDADSQKASTAAKRKNASDPPMDDDSDFELDPEDAIEMKEKKKRKASEVKVEPVETGSGWGATTGNAKSGASDGKRFPHVVALYAEIEEGKQYVTGITVVENAEKVTPSGGGLVRPDPCYSNFISICVANKEKDPNYNNSQQIAHLGNPRMLSGPVWSKYGIGPNSVKIGKLYGDDGSVHMGKDFKGDEFEINVMWIHHRVKIPPSGMMEILKHCKTVLNEGITANGNKLRPKISVNNNPSVSIIKMHGGLGAWMGEDFTKNWFKMVYGTDANGDFAPNDDWAIQSKHKKKILSALWSKGTWTATRKDWFGAPRSFLAAGERN